MSGSKSRPAAWGSQVEPAVRVQILATEHQSLLATRSLTWNEMFTRANSFITVLSASVVALALVAQATEFGPGARLFAVVVLPVVAVIGLLTFVRLGEANTEDIALVVGMNRLRRGYFDIAPDLEPYFITAGHDDQEGILRSYGAALRRSPARFLAGTPALVGIITAVVVGVLGALLAAWFVDEPLILVLAGVATALVMGGIEAAMVRRAVRQGRSRYVPRFPTPEAAEPSAGNDASRRSPRPAVDSESGSRR